MKKIGYCHWCNKYADLNYGFCPFCSSQLISISTWNKMTNKEREDWLNRNPRHNPPKKCGVLILTPQKRKTSKPVLNLKRKLVSLSTSPLAQCVIALT